MSYQSRREYLIAIIERYKKAERIEKTLILNEFVQVCGYHRKYAIALLNGKRRSPGLKKGPERKYDEKVANQICLLWNTLFRPCSKKLKAALKELIEFYPDELEPELKQKLHSISSATIDRILRNERKVYGISTTRGVKRFRNQIPIKLKDWNIDRPGYLEADTVSHCGENASGSFASSITLVDIYSDWTENRAILGKSAQEVTQKIKEMDQEISFDLIGFRSDNGSEFLNDLLNTYLQSQGIDFARTRPYRKNDNAHVEQKNHTHVRKLLGYERIDSLEIVALMNLIYTQLWNPLNNYFIPSMKLQSKHRFNAKIKKIYDAPKTPFQRIIDCPNVSEEVKVQMRQKKEKLNPFHLKRQLDLMLHVFYSKVKKQRTPIPQEVA
jgi:hypothetical protein